ncbi:MULTISPECIES: hypothetical protein [unclassified Bradyrhizobium]|uniref:hypothetical protein n=1 Tax=unclassified Bradyrhizobium TaxID=2631580 RepID=UPI0029163728|nr:MULTISPECIES: hypothetical protein [unclassified Bradyrhizobium]
MSADTLVFPGMLLSDQFGESSYTVGAIIFDRNNVCYGLTARHVLEKQRSNDVVDAFTGRVIGQRVVSDPQWDAQEPFHHAIGRFVIPSASVKMATPYKSVVGLADPRELVGSDIFWLSDSDGNAPAKVMAVGGAVSINWRRRNGSSMSTTMSDVIKVETLSAPVAGPGELGTLLVDRSDRAVGLLIFRHGDTAFVAPLLPYLDELKAKLADDRHSAVSGVNRNLESMRADLLQVDHGMARMKRELQSSADTPGLGDEEAPADLDKLLAAAS